MAESPLFKRAFVRGLNSELVRQGVVVYPSKEAADYAADFIADTSGMPDPYAQANAVTHKVAEHLCNNLVTASRHLCKQAGNKYNPAVTKTAQEATPVSAAADDAWALMEKAAAETGALMEGGDNTNDMPAAASGNAEAALENKQRPENYANMGEQGVGNYERKGEGSVGHEEDHPEKPKATGEGSNSVTENSAKHGSLQAIVNRIAKTSSDMGLMSPGKDTNDLPAAATYNAEAAQELARRPENYANKGESGVGRSDMVPNAGSQVGTEQPHPEAPKATDSGKTNVPLEHVSKSAFDQLFESTATSVVPYLPEKMATEKKVAHVRAMMGLESRQRATYLHDLYTTLGAKKEAAQSVRDHFFKTAMANEADSEPKSETKESDGPGLPPALRAAIGEKKEEKKEEKTAGVNSLSSLRAAIASLND